ncbi:unnamed protein product [Oikopleura dioica]|uniref:Uncharacterized protein n=1 Tax=Oikopleura dioica TaxID=34765 RepID=E4Y4R1_OIKDI|nr:unnamed protein product [Oikopleura dioica]
MHRAYQPTTAANNRLLKKRWDQRQYDLHRNKVADIKPQIDNKAPRTYMHMHLKLKKLQVEEERLAVVERDNRILLEKMSYIMRTKGKVDNWNQYHQKSLNKSSRQRELLRVTHENQAILKRISSKEPHYNHDIWEEEWDQNLLYMQNISNYPIRWLQNKKRQENLRKKEKLNKTAPANNEEISERASSQASHIDENNNEQ